MSIEIENSVFEELAVIGTNQTENAIAVETAQTNMVGVRVNQKGPKKAINLDVVVPTRRSESGSRRTTTVQFTGHQARRIYEALKNFYETRQDVENDTGVFWY